MADKATLKSQYTAQVEADLERNATERERLAAEMTALRDQLTALEEDHSLLVGVRHALVNGTVPGVRSSGTGTRQNAAAAKLSRAHDPETTVTAIPGNRQRPELPQAKAATKKPTWMDIVAENLSRHAEPRSATEIAAELAQAHPRRRVQTTVVRNTLEGLVAKGHVVRSKQNRSVFYTTATEAAPADASRRYDHPISA